MHRPKKKKNTDPLIPEDNVVDERHLIDVEDSADISFEDRVSIYWMENKGFIMGCVAVLAFIIAAVNGLRMYKNHAENSLKAEFAAADAENQLAAFADSHANKDLGGVAALITADQAYTDGDYEKALNYYKNAGQSLKGTLLRGRALTGEAFALYQSGEEAEAIARLKAIAADQSLAEAVRAEAAYHLALEADYQGDTATYESYAAQINASPLAGPWQQRLSFHQQSR